MAFRYLISFCALVACANAGLLASHVAIANPSVDAVASTQQNVVRSFGGTVSSYSKAVDTPYSSVRKSDTRIQNNVYTPAIAKTTYAAAPLYTQATPIVAKTLVHAPAPVVEKTIYAPAHAPVLAKTVYSAPAPVVAKTVYSAPAPVYAAPAPVLAKTVYSAPVAKAVYAAPAPVYAAPAPVVAKTVYSAPAPVVAKTVYSAPAPVYAAPAPTVHYSPAESVSHMSFDGFGTHWGF
ncbi:cuticle protein 76 isoform X2 [Drosophila biarmipes]|uniref:cuticle protein 76 isoform X2 n=1 Tax=Drosophila biarmipes TaxID=125945 RepID=UPI0021CCF30C|nr:cuticle protein 76 isoform X2 [Drosophila biarmipes]